MRTQAQRLINALRYREVLTNRDLREIAEQGVPVYRTFQRAFDLDVNQIQDIRRANITPQQAYDALMRAGRG